MDPSTCSAHLCSWVHSQATCLDQTPALPMLPPHSHSAAGLPLLAPRPSAAQIRVGLRTSCDVQQRGHTTTGNTATAHSRGPVAGVKMASMLLRLCGQLCDQAVDPALFHTVQINPSQSQCQLPCDQAAKSHGGCGLQLQHMRSGSLLRVALWQP